MGAWGIKALESNEGLDVVDFLADNYLPEHTELNLDEIISKLMEEGLVGESPECIDFLYDNSAMAVVELYLEWLDTGKLDHDTEDEPKWGKVSDFSASISSLDYLLRCLNDIHNGVPDEDGERETVELWKDSSSWEEWSSHLNMLIQRLQQLRNTY